ncbi:MAG: LacI family DNA-binding transcriptional regulator [Caulobacteraceae bacterium]|nr:LacI family DNA-binding transcriptional regulator [Caulobacter sp.]
MSKARTRLEDIAALAGVSIATASRALNDSPAVARPTKLAVWRLAREHGYPFKAHMPAGPIGAAATIVVVTPRHDSMGGLLNTFLLELMAGVTDAARARDCDVLVSYVSPTSANDLQVLMSTNRADGVIFLGQSSLHSEFNRLAERESRFVVWGAALPDQQYCCIGSDNYAGGRRATTHLLRLGRRRIAFLGDVDTPEPGQRQRGYLDALQEAGVAVDADLLVPSHFDVESAETAIDSLLDRRTPFDGVVAASDQLALGASRALHVAGVSVPDDVSLVGYDNLPFARFSRPALTTIAQDTGRAGRLLVSKLLTSRDGADIRSERLPTDLIVRESCGG